MNQSILNSNKVAAMCRYWASKYGHYHDDYIFNDLLSEALIACWEMVTKYPTKPENELLKIFNQAIKYRVCQYYYRLRRQTRATLLGDMTTIAAYKPDIDNMVEVVLLYDKADLRTQLLMQKVEDGYSLREIGRQMNISHERVNQLLHKEK